MDFGLLAWDRGLADGPGGRDRGGEGPAMAMGAMSQSEAPSALAREGRAEDGMAQALEAEAARDEEIARRKVAERERDAAALRAAEAARRAGLARREASERRAQAEEAEAGACRIRAELADMTRERDALVRSTSWRITAPLRAAARWLPAGLRGAMRGGR